MLLINKLHGFFFSVYKEKMSFVLGSEVDNSWQIALMVECKLR